MPILEGFELLESVQDATAMWGNDQVVKNFTAKADTANAILSKQTAKNEALTSTEKDNGTIKVRWMNFTDETVSTFVNATGPEVCDLDGAEVTSGTKTYALDTFVEKSFKVEETGSGFGHGFRGLDADFQQAVTIGLLKTRKALVEDLNKRVLAKLDTFTGTNKYYTATFKDAATPTGDTIIPAASFNARTVLPYLARVQMMNKYVDPYILDGGLLYDDFYISQFGSTASDSVKLQSLFGQFDITQDMWGFSEASLDDRMYLIDKNAVGLFHKHHIATGAVINRPGDRKDYTMALPELGNDVTADVHYQYKCEGNKYFHVWKLVLRYGLLANPVIEDTDLTGVLAFRKGA
jgi:hypothetical protein